MDIYGIIKNGTHIDVSNTQRGAKIIATKLGYDTISIRYNCGYIARELAYKNKNGNWINLTNGQQRYDNK